MSRGGRREGAGGKHKWIHGETKVIRVPVVLAVDELPGINARGARQEAETGIRKDVHNWLLTERAKSYIESLSAKTGIPVLDLVQVKKGGNASGTWLHPKLATPFGTWLSIEYEFQVSDWVEQWMTTGQNPLWVQADLDRVIYRDTLKDEARLRMTDQVKIYLQRIKKYDNERHRGFFFAKVHDSINIAVANETAKQMRIRLSQILGREVKESELIRDYFPPLHLTRYISVCEVVANFMIRDELHPDTAIERAIEIALPANYIAEQIDFVEHINFVRQRLGQPILGQGNSDLLPG